MSAAAPTAHDPPAFRRVTSVKLADLTNVTDPPADSLFVRTTDRDYDDFYSTALTRASEFTDLFERTVAIVGSRACTPHGRDIARWFAREIAAAGVTVISGLARGIDTAAHEGALDVDGGKTVAVLGCGIDRVYPMSNTPLADRIEANGAIVSEYGPGIPPEPWRFPARNRIVAALADAVVVIEARERSGSLITADFAKDMGRPVFAVPGPVRVEGHEVTTSVGTNNLLRAGGLPAIHPRDVLAVLGVSEGV